MRGVTRFTRIGVGFCMIRGQSPSDFDAPDEIEGTYVFSCPFKMDKRCVGVSCVREFSREERHRSLQILYYDNVRLREEKSLLFLTKEIMEYHIVKRALHYEGFCRLFQKDVWALHKQEDSDYWFEENQEKPDTPYILKKLEDEDLNQSPN